jgi:protein-disulfide isomerase
MNFPLSFHANAQKAAEAFECAADQGKAYEMYDKMFANQNALSVSDLKRYAQEIGLDTARFGSCLDNGEKAQAVNAQLDLGTQYGVEGTPTFFINGKKVVGAQPIDVFRQAINEALGR